MPDFADFRSKTGLSRSVVDRSLSNLPVMGFLKCGAKRSTSIDSTLKNPCGARNSVCLFVCLFVDTWGFRIGRVRTRDSVFLRVIGPGKKNFLKCGAKRRTSMETASKNPCGARNSVCLYVCLCVTGWGFCYGGVWHRETTFLGVV